MTIEISELIQEIKEKNDIVSVISDYVSLRRAGRSFLGLCPFHSEKTPSFNVNPAKQFFYCFGCGTGGDVFSFLMKIENMEFLEAAHRLADRAGIPWPEKPVSLEAQNKAELYRINKLVAVFYHQCLLKTQSGQLARNYLEKRGINSKLWVKFNLGYAPAGWNHLTDVLRRKEVQLENCEKLGLLSFGEKGYYDRFRDRLMFPIFDAKGNISGFGGRIFDNSHPKYLNSPDTELFHKGEHWYGLHLAKDTIRKLGQAIVMEGYMDVIQAHQHGFSNAIASLGTALTAQQAKQLKRYASEVILAYDSDSAGQSATLKGIEILKNVGLNVKVMSLPDGHDPDSLLRTCGAEMFQTLLGQVDEAVNFLIDHTVRQYNIHTPEGKAAAVREVLPQLAMVENNVVREEYLRKLARESGVSETAISEELRLWQVAKRKKKYILDRNIQNSYTNRTNVNNGEDMDLIDFGHLSPLEKAIFEVEKELLQSALQEYDKFERIKEQLNPGQLHFKLWRQLFEELLNRQFNRESMENFLNEVQESFRQVAASLMAEAEMKDLRSVDITALINRWKMLQLQEQIQSLTQQISSGKDEQGQSLTEIALKEKVLAFTELKRTLQREFPNFTAGI